MRTARLEMEPCQRGRPLCAGQRFQNAVSIASMLLSTNSLIVEKKVKQSGGAGAGTGMDDDY